MLIASLSQTNVQSQLPNMSDNTSTAPDSPTVTNATASVSSLTNDITHCDDVTKLQGGQQCLQNYEQYLSLFDGKICKFKSKIHLKEGHEMNYSFHFCIHMIVIIFLVLT